MRGSRALRLSCARGGDEHSARQAASADPVLPLHSQKSGQQSWVGGQDTPRGM